MSRYFPKPWERSDGNVKVELGLSNYATKSDLASLKAEVDKVDIDKLKAVPAGLGKPNNVVDNVV